MSWTKIQHCLGPILRLNYIFLIMIEKLLDWDRSFFVWINSALSNSIFDSVMPWITDLHHSAWGLFILAGLLLVIVWHFRWQAFYGTFLCVLAVGLSDSISHQLIKPFFQRARPQGLPDAVLRTFAHAGYSFPSNHAANNMAIAVIFGLLIPPLRWILFIFAIVIGFSRIYVGVHYPLDVLGGFVLGYICAMSVYLAFRPVQKRILKML